MFFRSHLFNLTQVLNTLNKTTKAMLDAHEIYKNLKDKCKVAKNCSKAEQFCCTKTLTVRKHSKHTRTCMSYTVFHITHNKSTPVISCICLLLCCQKYMSIYSRQLV